MSGRDSRKQHNNDGGSGGRYGGSERERFGRSKSTERRKKGDQDLKQRFDWLDYYTTFIKLIH